jgi:sarcosine oxidase/L-pipecolate oxidase
MADRPVVLASLPPDGILNVTSDAAPRVTRDVVEKYYLPVQSHPGFKGQVRRVTGHAETKELAPGFTGPVEGWSGYYNKLAGYAHSANALEAVYKACLALGVKFKLGHMDGEAEVLLYASSLRNGMTCIGARTKGGNVHLADKTIVALGASTPTLISSIGRQMTGRCWGIAHIQLTTEEVRSLRGSPVTNVRDLAFFFEPDHETNKLKFCHMGGAFTNFSGGSKAESGLSIPFTTLSESQFIPADDERYIRQLLREVLPDLADRPLIDAHLC